MNRAEVDRIVRDSEWSPPAWAYVAATALALVLSMGAQLWG